MDVDSGRFKLGLSLHVCHGPIHNCIGLRVFLVFMLVFSVWIINAV